MATGKISKNFAVDVVRIPHEGISAHGYGSIGFNVNVPSGMTLLSLTPISDDVAISLTIRYSDGWQVVYYNAYSGTTSPGTFEVRAAFAK